MSTPHRTITHDAQHSRYVLHVDGQEAGHLEYRDEQGVRNFFHTFVHPDHRGQGHASHLIRHALDEANTAGLRYQPSCSAVDHYIAEHPEYAAGLFRIAE